MSRLMAAFHLSPVSRKLIAAALVRLGGFFVFPEPARVRACSSARGLVPQAVVLDSERHLPSASRRKSDG
ncbi:hypothetical protein [Comamonas thiooxydans]|uniref:hypothetical protein n=1 Tax=Comamonas thiooxydans TaxID=363952 RepID=UPI00209C3C5F|nr:hypothetical protein [Comamonas thiooxydans]MCO8251127.1 hypothetical protein [Comamonas thiooxydans]